MSRDRALPPPASPSPSFWKIPQQETVLSPGHVHVWRGTLDSSPARLHLYRDTLSQDERERARRLKIPRHRERFTAARGILRHILGRYLRTPPGDIRFGLGPHGKPFLQYPASPALHFNVAHSQHVAVYAVSGDCEVGIDLEGGRNHADYRMLAERICSPEEFTMFQALPQAEQRAAFLTCWTRKEALVKATGKGLVFPLKHLTVSFTPDDPPRILHVREPSADVAHWALVDLPLETGFRGALAMADRPCLVQGWDYDLSAENRAVQMA